MKKPFVFISYSTKDSDVANLVHSYLEGNGIHCWIASRNIEGGASFVEEIVDAIEDCSAFVMVFSEHSNSSHHVSTELSQAFDEGKKIIPFKLGEFALSKSSRYYLTHAQWIDATLDRNEALKSLLKVVKAAFPQEEQESLPTKPVIKRENPVVAADTPVLSREEMVALLLDKIEKFPYCLRGRAYGENHDAFRKLARVLFSHTVSMYYNGRPTAGGIDYVDIIADTLSQGQGVSIHVKGLPGCAKNMLLQLAYYKMLARFSAGESDYLPMYLSSSYYEKRPYNQENARQEMTALIGEECKEYFAFLRANPNVHPVLMVEAVREHVVASFAPDDVIMDLWQPYGKFNRVVAVDVGLVKNRQRLKKAIPLMGDASGYTFQFRSIPITDKQACLSVIRTILDMYIEKHDGLEPLDIYKTLYRLRFSTVDIFTVRLVATELSQGLSAKDITLTDMYERLALGELKGDEDKMLAIAHELYEYVFNERHNVKTKQYNAVMWSLPHKHNTYLEFMVAYYFSHCVMTTEKGGDFHFLAQSMTSMENHFMVSRMKDNYVLQEALLQLVLSNYQDFDVAQKANAAYWLGKLTFAELTDAAETFLDSEHDRLLPLVQADNSQTLANRYNQYLFRSVCHGLISYGRTNILDEYLCLIVTNDITNAINRGTIIQYMGDNYQGSTHNDFYLDDNPSIGEQALRILCSSVEATLSAKRTGYVETDLVSLLTLIQARMHVTPEKLPYNLVPFCEKTLSLLREYQRRPRSVVSDQLLYYFRSVEDDLSAYVENSRFDAAFALYKGLSGMKDTKRIPWVQFGIEDPESVAEHTLGALMMGMVFLPTEYPEQHYNKQTILDMLLVHDMAEGILGDSPSQLSEPTKELKQQNALMRKLFLKGTYPEVANMTHYYAVWAEYYEGVHINARIARDINLIQTVNTFFTYFSENPTAYTLPVVRGWLAEGEKLSTDLGYDLFDRIIVRNPTYRKAVDGLITAQKAGE